jgi:hypothetical protein
MCQALLYYHCKSTPAFTYTSFNENVFVKQRMRLHKAFREKKIPLKIETFNGKTCISYHFGHWSLLAPKSATNVDKIC